MILKVIEGVLPGLRSLKPALIGGVFWALVLWWTTAPQLTRGPEHPFLSQVRAVARVAGRPITLFVASLLVFALGVIMSAVVNLLSTFLGWVATETVEWWRWQVYARKERKRLENLVILGEDLSPAEVPEHEDLVEGLREPAADAKEDLKLFRARFIPIKYARRTVELERAIGTPPERAGAGLERVMIHELMQQGRLEVVHRMEDLGKHDPIKDMLLHHDNQTADRLEARLKIDLDSDPMDVIRSVSEPLYLEMERSRSEHQVRSAFSWPIFALGIQLSWRHHWWFATLSAAALIVIVYAALEHSAEKDRVIKWIRLHELPTPALRQAIELGREDAKRYARWAGATLKIPSE